MSSRAKALADATPPVEPPTPIDPDPGTPQTPPAPPPAPDLPLPEPPTPIDRSWGSRIGGRRNAIGGSSKAVCMSTRTLVALDE